MLRAGAKAVFWLKIMNESLESDFSELFNNIEKQYGKNVPLICESNSLRNVINTGFFPLLTGLETKI
jgi:hypothetical protein